MDHTYSIDNPFGYKFIYEDASLLGDWVMYTPIHEDEGEGESFRGEGNGTGYHITWSSQYNLQGDGISSFTQPARFFEDIRWYRYK